MILQKMKYKIKFYLMALVFSIFPCLQTPKWLWYISHRPLVNRPSESQKVIAWSWYQQVKQHTIRGTNNIPDMVLCYTKGPRLLLTILPFQHRFNALLYTARISIVLANMSLSGYWNPEFTSWIVKNPKFKGIYVELNKRLKPSKSNFHTISFN